MQPVRIARASGHGLPGVMSGVVAPVLVLTQITSLQVGSAVAKDAYGPISPTGLAGIRLAFSAVIMILLVRPKLRPIGVRQWRASIGLGIVLAAMNLAYFQAIGHLPIGVASTLELLGPLTLSLALTRKPSHLLAAVTAVSGVVLLTAPGGSWPAVGVLLGIVAALCRTAYVILNQRVGQLFTDWTGLTVALMVGTVGLAPIAVAVDGAAITARPQLALVGLIVAILSSVIPYSLDMIVLRRIGGRRFGVLLALGPAVAAAVGFVSLHEHLSAAQLAGIGLVVFAAAWSAKRANPPTSTTAPTENHPPLKLSQRRRTVHSRNPSRIRQRRRARPRPSSTARSPALFN
jgi:inner membrane transporter RhtA